MNKILISIAALALMLVAGFYLINSYIYEEKQTPSVTGHRDAEYRINGNVVRLVNGVSETEAAPGSASKIVTRYFGNEVWKDLNGDGMEDVVFILTQTTGGSGTMYYAVAALATGSEYRGSEGIFLGDRIAPQTTESGPGNSVIINYADRAQGESFAAQPSVGKSMRLILDTGSMQFGEVAQNFEGEADPSRMTLGMKKWAWVRTTMNDGKSMVPKKANAFTLSFGNDGKIAITTDCNTMGGSYAVTGSNIAFAQLFATKMYCEGSQEGEFAKSLQEVGSYSFTSKGELLLEIRMDSGIMVFN